MNRRFIHVLVQQDGHELEHPVVDPEGPFHFRHQRAVAAVIDAEVMAAVPFPELVGQFPAAPFIDENEEPALGGDDLPDPVNQGLPVLLGHVRVHDNNGFVSPHTLSLWMSKPRWRTGARMDSVPTIKKGLARLKANPRGGNWWAVQESNLEPSD